MADAARLRELAEEHHAYVASDNAYQRRARLLQALWREKQGLPIGEHRGRTLGSRIAMPAAEDDLLNYITDTVRDVVRREVLDPVRSRDKLYAKPRIFNDLLSSQPLCFNLFGELQADLGLASRVLSPLTAGRISEVTDIEFEHSPGRGDPRYTGDRSAFDVYVEFITPAGGKGFCGIEVKYHEDLGDKPAPHRARYDEIADAMGEFEASRRSRLRDKPLQQIWRDHLLAGSLLLDPDAGFDDGFFAFLYPSGNDRCAAAVESYRGCLNDERSFAPWTLEAVVDTVHAAGAGRWAEDFAGRYLGYGKVAE